MSSSSQSHPYSAYEDTETWHRLDEGITALVENKDLIEQTNRAYIVGSLCKALLDKEAVRLR
jgi:hypothetical protein